MNFTDSGVILRYFENFFFVREDMPVWGLPSLFAAGMTFCPLYLPSALFPLTQWWSFTLEALLSLLFFETQVMYDQAICGDTFQKTNWSKTQFRTLTQRNIPCYTALNRWRRVSKQCFLHSRELQVLRLQYGAYCRMDFWGRPEIQKYRSVKYGRRSDGPP